MLLAIFDKTSKSDVVNKNVSYDKSFFVRFISMQNTTNSPSKCKHFLYI